MSEIDELKKRIDESGPEGVLTALVRDDYEPAGDLMMRGLVESGDYAQRKLDHEWRIYKSGMEPF